jgi:hypothetical protein
MRFAVPLLAACVQNQIVPKETGPAPFDDEDTDTPSDTADTVDTGRDSDSKLPASCEDRYFPAEAVPVLAECGPASPGLIDPKVLWRNEHADDMLATPVVGHLSDDDGDGVPGSAGDIPDVVAVNVHGDILVVSGADGLPIWSLPAIAGTDPASPAIGDVDGDGWADVVVSGIGGTWAYHGADGTEIWSTTKNGQQCGAVGLADLDADGSPEVLLGRSILSGLDGTNLGDVDHGWGSGVTHGLVMGAMGVAADLDGDGLQEQIAGNAAYDSTVSSLWYNGESDAWVAMGDFDGDPEGEIVASADGTVRLQDDDGSVIWESPLGEKKSGPPTIADFDGDGAPEIGVATYGGYHVLDTDGSRLWTAAIDDSSSGSAVGVAFDLDADGILDVVVADQQDVWIFNGRTGAVEAQVTEHSSSTCGESAVIADVNADGHADIVYGSLAVFGPERGLTALTSESLSWQSARGTWNQHGYAITNIDDDGTVPTSPAPSWATSNTFRANVPADTASAGADLEPLILEICEERCDAGEIQVWLSIANQGLVDVTAPVEVEVYGLTETGRVLLGTETWTVGIATGMRTESLHLVFTGVPTPLLDLEVVLDGRRAIAECDDGNNTAGWGGVVCL